MSPPSFPIPRGRSALLPRLFGLLAIAWAALFFSRRRFHADPDLAECGNRVCRSAGFVVAGCRPGAADAKRTWRVATNPTPLNLGSGSDPPSLPPPPSVGIYLLPSAGPQLFMAAAVSLGAGDFSLPEARAAWSRSLHLRYSIRSAGREAHTLSLLVARQLDLLSRASPPADLRLWARSLHLPYPSLRRLLALAAPPPIPPAATLSGLDFLLRLDPAQWALARCGLEILSRRPHDLDCSRLLADAFASQTQGSLRAQLRAFFNADPLAFLPDRVAALSPVTVPAVVPAPTPLPPLSHASPIDLGSAWRRLQSLRHDRHSARAELSQLQLNLAAVLFSQWQILARPGRSSHFSAWLLAAGIPRSSAYRLLRQCHPSVGNSLPIPLPRKHLNCPENAPDPPPSAVLHQGKLLVHLTPQHATIVHSALSGLLASQRPFDPARIFLAHLEFCIPESERAPLASLWRSPPTKFPSFVRPFRLFAVVLNRAG